MAQYKKVGNLKVRTDLSPEKQALVNEIAKNYVQQNKKIDAERRGNIARGRFGAAVSGLSFHPILNVPYVGTGVGGALFDLGQGIVAGDKAKDLMKRAGRGFAIGETVGAVPYVGKFVGKTKAGQAVVNSAPVKTVENALNKAGEKIAQNPAVQKAYDALMTDIRAFNPNKQTVYHGSPKDFEKFSNEAIGTGEGAQAHGYGHYAAKSKDVGEGYRNRLGGYEYEGNPVNNKSERDLLINEIIDNGYNNTLSRYQKELNNMNDIAQKWEHSPNDYKEVKGLINELENKINIINNIDTSKISRGNGQLYKLSIPKDDVMLREDLPFNEQSKAVQDALENIRNKTIKEKGYKSIDEVKEQLNAISDEYEKIIREQAAPVWEWSSTPVSNYQLELSKLERLNNMFDYGGSSKNIYDNLARQLGKEETSKLLNKYGIKGISYNGGIDGEARVIFNPDDIVIGRKYYNQPTLKDIYDRFINSGTFAGAVTNP